MRRFGSIMAAKITRKGEKKTNKIYYILLFNVLRRGKLVYAPNSMAFNRVIESVNKTFQGNKIL